MGKTYRRNPDDDGRQRKPKRPNHSSGKRSGGMRVINDIFEDDDSFEDDVDIHDEIVIDLSSADKT